MLWLSRGGTGTIAPTRGHVRPRRDIRPRRCVRPRRGIRLPTTRRPTTTRNPTTTLNPTTTRYPTTTVRPRRDIRPRRYIRPRRGSDHDATSGHDDQDGSEVTSLTQDGASNVRPLTGSAPTNWSRPAFGFGAESTRPPRKIPLTRGRISQLGGEQVGRAHQPSWQRQEPPRPSGRTARRAPRPGSACSRCRHRARGLARSRRAMPGATRSPGEPAVELALDHGEAPAAQRLEVEPVGNPRRRPTTVSTDGSSATPIATPAHREPDQRVRSPRSLDRGAGVLHAPGQPPPRLDPVPRLREPARGSAAAAGHEPFDRRAPGAGDLRALAAVQQTTASGPSPPETRSRRPSEAASPRRYRRGPGGDFGCALMIPFERHGTVRVELEDAGELVGDADPEAVRHGLSAVAR